MILAVGEKIHIVERRYFADDLRRHFCGEVLDFTDHLIRATGYVWALDPRKNQFMRRDEKRQRLFCLGDRLTINILPKGVDLKDVQYVFDPEIGYMVTDGKLFSFNITEFTTA